MADGLETIATAGSPAEAEMIRSQLEAAGIPAFIVGEQTFNLNLIQLDPLGDGIRIQVPVDAVDDAIAVLNDEQRDDSPQDGLLLPDAFPDDSSQAGPLSSDALLDDPSQAGLSLSSHALLEAEAGDDSPQDGPICPNCQSDLIYPRELPMLLHIFSLLLLGLPYLLIPRRQQCRSCGTILT